MDTCDFRTDIVPGEIFVSDPIIHIEATEPVDAESAQGAITVPGVAGVVSLSNEARTIAWKPGGAVKPGHYELRVGDLQTTGGRSVGAAAAIPFTITESRAPIPAGSAVVAMSRLRVHDEEVERLSTWDRPEGRFLEVMKVLNRRTGAMATMAFDECGERVDFDAVQRQLEEARRDRYGKLHPALHRLLGEASPSARLEVAVWLQAAPLADPARLESRQRGSMSKEEQRHRRYVAKLSEDCARKLAKEDERSYARADRLAPLVYAILTPDQIREVAQSDEVVALFLHETDGIEDLQDSISIAHADDAQALGATGQGVNVAVWESGPDDTKDLPIAGFFDPDESSTSAHARLVCAIVKNIEPFAPKGFAPNCSLYSANSMSLNALTWAVDEASCTVVNQSFHRRTEPGSAFLSLDDVLKDWLALQWPYPTIVQAAGNYWSSDPDGIVPPSSEYVNHKGYNSLTVGNHNDAATAMWGTSVFRNPFSASGDRELPEISANGAGVSAVGMSRNGTSFASPAVAGTAAQIQEVNTTLKNWPEGCRAILLAGASRNVEGSTWWQDVGAGIDAKDGSGALDSRESVRIAMAKRDTNNPSARRGWNVGTLADGEFDGNNRSTFVYRLHAPGTSAGPWHAKIALAWAGRVVPNGFLATSILAHDLDLEIFNDNGLEVAGSWSRDNSYEIAEFSPMPGRVYTIRIRRSAGDGLAFYGIAWRVTGGIQLQDPDVLTSGLGPSIG